VFVQKVPVRKVRTNYNCTKSYTAVRMYAEYDPISLFERNLYFRVNIETFQKTWGFQGCNLKEKCLYLTVEVDF
jgi:hypothetical protein